METNIDSGRATDLTGLEVENHGLGCCPPKGIFVQSERLHLSFRYLAGFVSIESQQREMKPALRHRPILGAKGPGTQYVYRFWRFSLPLPVYKVRRVLITCRVVCMSVQHESNFQGNEKPQNQCWSPNDFFPDRRQS